MCFFYPEFSFSNVATSEIQRISDYLPWSDLMLTKTLITYKYIVRNKVTMTTASKQRLTNLLVRSEVTMVTIS